MSPNHRQTPYRVAIEGFGAFEREAIAACLRLADRRVLAYAAAESLAGSDLVVVDADRAESLAQVTTERRVRDAVFVGTTPPAGAAAWLQRPIDPLKVLRALDTLLAARLGLAAPLAPAAAPAPAVKRRPNRALAATPRGGRGRPVLVVDDSAVARAFLADRLHALGYSVRQAASWEEALAEGRADGISIAFVDLKLGDGDPHGGLELCRRLKASGPDAPAVVITTGSGIAADRVRGSLAGCDAYLVKPLLADDFEAALRQVDPLYAAAPA